MQNSAKVTQIEEYCDASPSLELGDIIISINGATEIKKAISELKKVDVWELTVTRYAENSEDDDQSLFSNLDSLSLEFAGMYSHCC